MFRWGWLKINCVGGRGMMIVLVFKLEWCMVPRWEWLMVLCVGGMGMIVPVCNLGGRGMIVPVCMWEGYVL